MSEFQNVTVVREANVYFDGKVTSRTVRFADGSRVTLGIMLPGEYRFGTREAEVMEILSGELQVLLPGLDDWREIGGGERFEVPADAEFSVRVVQVTDYCCSYVS